MARQYAIGGPLGGGYVIDAENRSFAVAQTYVTYKPAAGGAYNLPAVAGSYALSGAVTSLEYGREAAADAGSYALTGTAASLEYGREVLAVGGSYALTGATASLLYARRPVAVSGSYSLTGTATSLELGKEIAAVSGSYSLTGTAATLRHAYKPVAVSGTYTLTGTPATLTKTAGATIFVGLTAGVTDGVIGSGGSLPTGWALASGDVTLTIVGHGADDSVETFDLKIDAVHGAASPYVDIYFPSFPGVAASAAQRWRAAAYRKIIASSGGSISVSDFALIGSTAAGALREAFHDATMPASSGAYQASYLENSHSLANVDTTRASGEMYFEIDASAADTSITLRLAANLDVVGAGVTAEPGSYDLSGTPAIPKLARKVPVLAGTYALTGQPTSLEYGREVLASNGSYALSGGVAALIRARRVTALGGSYALSGLPVNLLKSGAYAIIGLPGTYTLTGLPVGLAIGGVPMIPGSGQRDGDGGERRRHRPKIFHIIIEAAKKVVEKQLPLRKKRKRLAKIIAEEVLPEAGGLLAADKLLLELMIRRQLEQIPLNEMHTESWYELQDQLLEVITDAEQTAQRLRFESEEEDDLLLLLTS